MNHQQFREKFLFLQHIPDHLYFNLDYSEWVFPTAEIEVLREKLETEINHFVMTYKRSVFNRSIAIEKHLCANIKGADLNHKEIKLLEKYEREVIPFDISFVVYQKPLIIMNPLDFNNGDQWHMI